ncbi:hypothetical protein M8J77_002442 [Diaphorina citri]|nr:hypothetical protein M8J77_002442 [Diaphorina citri]
MPNCRNNIFSHLVLSQLNPAHNHNLKALVPHGSLKLSTVARVSKMWNLKTIIVPVIIGALGTIPKNIKKLEGDISLHKIQDIALCGSAQILRKTIY